MNSIFNSKFSFFLLLLLTVLSCGKDDDSPTPTTTDPIASFQFEVSATNFLEVAFSNFSSNATSYSWDFGDGNTSTEESPTHAYAAAGDFTVVLTASNGTTDKTQSKTISLTDPNTSASLLTGGDSKTWYLRREGIALGVGPAIDDNSSWSFGGVTPLAERPCILDDAYTFHADGTFEFSSGGTIFVDASACCGGWHEAEGCWDESDSNVWGDNPSRSDFGDGGDYTYVFDNANQTLTLNGSGAFIGLPNKTESGDNPDPVSTKTYAVFNLAEGDVADTLNIALEGVTWNFYLVSYHNPADLPAIPTDIPPFGEDYPDISPTELSNTFAAQGDFVLLDTIGSGSSIDYGVDDPADAMAAKVGQFNRTDVVDYQNYSSRLFQRRMTSILKI